jgi:SRSO17 transposase
MDRAAKRGHAHLPGSKSRSRAKGSQAHVPASIRFKTKPQIALEQIRAALLAGVPPRVVLMDASYGNNSKLRQDLTGLGTNYLAAI